jgi:hypothetical protein
MLRRIGDRCGPAIPDGEDFVHYDFTPANLLSDGTAITGVIDINPPILPVTAPSTWRPCCSTTTTTTRSATHSAPGSWTWPGPRAAGAYLAHMALRQVDGSLRHHPAATTTQRHLRLARIIITDIGQNPAH